MQDVVAINFLSPGLLDKASSTVKGFSPNPNALIKPCVTMPPVLIELVSENVPFWQEHLQGSWLTFAPRGFYPGTSGGELLLILFLASAATTKTISGPAAATSTTIANTTTTTSTTTDPRPTTHDRRPTIHDPRPSTLDPRPTTTTTTIRTTTRPRPRLRA